MATSKTLSQKITESNKIKKTGAISEQKAPVITKKTPIYEQTAHLMTKKNPEKPADDPCQGKIGSQDEK
jgi:hypothetical protein